MSDPAWRLAAIALGILIAVDVCRMMLLHRARPRRSPAPAPPLPAVLPMLYSATRVERRLAPGECIACKRTLFAHQPGCRLAALIRDLEAS